MHWRRVEVNKFHASTIVDTRHVVLKPSPGLGRLRVVGLASQQYPVSFICQRSLMASVTEYCHIGFQRGRVPMQVWAGRPDSEGGVGRVGPSIMKMWSSLGHISCYRNKHVQSKLRSITHVATKVHVIIRSFVVLTWMHDTSELV